MYQVVDFTAPTWADGKLLSPPTKKVNLALLPTPLHKCNSIPAFKSLDIEFYIKRDDMTSFDGK